MYYYNEVLLCVHNIYLYMFGSTFDKDLTSAETAYCIHNVIMGRFWLTFNKKSAKFDDYVNAVYKISVIVFIFSDIVDKSTRVFHMD
jgi:hypothetical protein